MSPAATILSFVSIGLWSFLAYFGASLNNVPLFLLSGIAMTIGGLVGAVKIHTWRVPFTTLLVGIGGVFGANFFYFLALQKAPAVEANLINYLWPLLIVVLSPVFFRKFALRPYHIIGVICGYIGAGLIVTGGRVSLDMANLPGYLFAAGAAILTWTAALTRGDPRIIGSLAYLTPLTSTLVLVVLGGHPFSMVAGIAMVLIVAGAVIGSLDLFRPKTAHRAAINQ